MAIAITIPRLGWNMDHGVFVGWLKRDGDPIRAGDPLFTLEGEKATQEIEANDQGILRVRVLGERRLTPFSRRPWLVPFLCTVLAGAAFGVYFATSRSKSS